MFAASLALFGLQWMKSRIVRWNFDLTHSALGQEINDTLLGNQVMRIDPHIFQRFALDEVVDVVVIALQQGGKGGGVVERFRKRTHQKFRAVRWRLETGF